ncbi:MAG TPA: hypothetical protein VFM32_01285 [Spongiibacteraceae bacterium]|nr:hypothetical protein [Spongiibacteraceae bacterium]
MVSSLLPIKNRCFSNGASANDENLSPSCRASNPALIGAYETALCAAAFVSNIDQTSLPLFIFFLGELLQINITGYR